MKNKLKLNSAEFGWIDFSAADMRRTREALAAVSSGSIDELGISIIRNGFAEELFPGLSGAQTSPKYLLLIPAMLKKMELEKMLPCLQGDTENNEGKVFAAFREKLIAMQCRFCDDACGEQNPDRENIIGNTTARRTDIPDAKRLVRFPHDIYWHGLYTFGLVDAPSMTEYVRNMCSRHSRKDDEKKFDLKQYWNRQFPLDYAAVINSAAGCRPLDLTAPEQEFLLSKIKEAVAGKNTLLEKVITACDEFNVEKNNVLSIAAALQKVSPSAAQFSIYMRCAFLGFNIACCSHDPQRIEPWLEEIRLLKGGQDFNIDFLDETARRFSYDRKKGHVLAYMKNYFSLLNNSFSPEKIRQSMIEWEKAAKGNKAYLEKNSSGNDDEWKGMEYLDFRLLTALKLFSFLRGSTHE